MLMVRARVRKHLTNLQRRFPSLANAKILSLPCRDYGFRLIVPKAVWVEALQEMAEEKTWTNFKNEAAARKADTGSAYINKLQDVWWEMLRLQAPPRRGELRPRNDGKSIYSHSSDPRQLTKTPCGAPSI
jgi:hypothetical protein